MLGNYTASQSTLRVLTCGEIEERRQRPRQYLLLYPGVWCLVWCAWYDVTQHWVKVSWTKQTQCFLTDEIILCRCMLFFFKALLAFSHCFYLFGCFYLSNGNLDLAIFRKNVSSSFKFFSVASQNKCHWVP